MCLIIIRLENLMPSFTNIIALCIFEKRAQLADTLLVIKGNLSASWIQKEAESGFAGDIGAIEV